MPSPIDQFRQQYQEFHRLSEARAGEQRRLLAEFEATLGGRGLLDATPDDLSAFAGALLARGLHVNTVRKKLNMIRPFYSWAFATDRIGADRYLKLKSVRNPRGSTGKTQPRPYTRAEIQQFWQALDEALPKLRPRGPGSQALNRWLQGRGPWRNLAKHAMRLQVEAIIHLALHCGLRRQEIYRLTVRDLHPENEYISVRYYKGHELDPDRTREVPWTDEARTAVSLWLEFRALMRPERDAAERPWLSCYGPLTFNHAMSWDRFGELLLKKVGPGWELHRFRHTCGTEWLRSDMDLEYVQQLLGHANIQQTLAYAQILKSDVAARMRRSEADFTEAVTNRAA
jgi:integrase